MIDLPATETNIRAALRENLEKNVFSGMGEMSQNCTTAHSQESDR